MRKKAQKIQQRISPLLVVLGIIIIILLSGCLQIPPQTEPDQTEPTQTEILFDPEQAEFYDPINNITERLWIKNHNYSGRSFYHQNQIELLAGLRDTQGNPGVNYSLVIDVEYYFYGETQTNNITAQLGLLLRTNNSGIAQTTFNYDQYTWPHGVNTEGHLEVSCNKIPNATAISRLFTFRYFRSRISRNSTSEGGVEVIYEFENKTLYEEAVALGNGQNDFVNWTGYYGGSSPIFIDAREIRMRSQYGGAPYEEFMYKAWAFHLDPLNISYHQIRVTWGEYIRKSLYDFSDSGPSKGVWESTGPLATVNISTGWLILQYMYEDTFTNGLDARILWYYQIAIVNDDLHLYWLCFQFDEAMA